MARGFFAELHRQEVRSARESERQRKATIRAYAAAVREAEAAARRGEQARVRAEQSRVRDEKATIVEQKRLEKEAKILHQEAMEASVECQNAQLASIEEELSGILAATLAVDDFVDLETFRVKAEHPPFDRADLLNKSRPPLPVIDPPMPVLVEPPPLRGIMSFVGKNVHQKKVAAAAKRYDLDLIQWQAIVEENVRLREREDQEYKQREQERLATLEVEEKRYAEACAAREEEAAKQNTELDTLISNLGYGTKEAIEEYIGIVLSNAVYPDYFPIGYGFTFEPSVAELRLQVAVITPDQLTKAKSYKFNKTTDDIKEALMSDKACRDRYSGAIEQVALRIPHEIFEADRRGLIETISLEVGTYSNDPATGLPGFIPFVALGVGREEFMKLDLSNVIPSATLAHLGASVSKNPFELLPAIVSGIRKS